MRRGLPGCGGNGISLIPQGGFLPRSIDAGRGSGSVAAEKMKRRGQNAGSF